ncbi:MAG: hypothetical protein FKY71_18500 [Spiribacter salinus]|uniref:Uncharacterized protein n=1 Tax=Spiribacter salinus TaxID=1335746 RepID=A0A540V8C8_9GAMM|nr:MAG: hypothetical protein FKY71_18500 [Spiribacter salinus]
MLADGASLTEFRAEIGGVSPQTVHNWKAKHPEFLEAFTRAEVMGQAYWEKKLRTELMTDNKANAPLVKLYFANRFGWSDRSSQEISGPNGGPVETVNKIEIVPGGNSAD